MTVAGWQEVVPAVTVDRVGVFMHEMLSRDPNVPPTRLVTDVSMRDGQKVIDLRSAILLRNDMDVPVEFRLETAPDAPPVILPMVMPGASLAVPVHLTHAVVKLRPSQRGCMWSSKGIGWDTFARFKPGERRGLCLACRNIGPVAVGETTAHSDDAQFYCCASVTCDPVPIALEPGLSHTLTLHAPFVLQNLLPVDTQYSLPDQGLHGDLRAGASVSLYDVNPASVVTLCIKIAGFQLSSRGVVSGGTRGIALDRRVTVLDSDRRPLYIELDSKRIRGSGGARVVAFFAPFWLVNRTALPLVFRQAMRSALAAGLSNDVYELSRPSLTMFACDGETLGNANKCCVRIGSVCVLRNRFCFWVAFPFLSCVCLIFCLSVRVRFSRAQSEWSPEVSLDAVGGLVTLEIKEYGSDGSLARVRDLAVDVSRAPDRFSRSKVRLHWSMSMLMFLRIIAWLFHQ